MNDVFHPQLHPNLDDLKLLKISMDHDSLKLEPKDKMITGIDSTFNGDL